MKHKKQVIVIALMTAIVVLIQCTKPNEKINAESEPVSASSMSAAKNKSLVAEGREIFRFDTFGDEDFWSGLLHIDKAILGINNGGFGPGVSPVDALNAWTKSRCRRFTTGSDRRDRIR